MTESFDPGALLGASYLLADGTRVRLRLAAARDLSRIEGLVAAAGARDAALEAVRLTRFDPRRRVVVCATALIGSTEQLVGVGAIGLDDASDPQPDLLIVDRQGPAGVGELLAGALVGRAITLARSRAA